MAGSPLDAEALDLLGGHAAPVPAAAAGGGAAAAPAPAPTAAGSGGVSAAAAPQGARQGPGTRLAIPVGVDDDEIQASMAALDAEMASGSAASFLDDVHAAPATAAAARRERRRKEAAARAAGGPSGTPPAKRSRPEVIDVDADSDEAERPDGPPAAAPAASATAADRDADGPGPGAAALVAVPQRAAAAAALPGGQMVLVDPEGPAGPPVPVPEVPAGPPIPVPVPVPVPAAAGADGPPVPVGECGDQSGAGGGSPAQAGGSDGRASGGSTGELVLYEHGAVVPQAGPGPLAQAAAGAVVLDQGAAADGALVPGGAALAPLPGTSPGPAAASAGAPRQPSPPASAAEAEEVDDVDAPGAATAAGPPPGRRGAAAELRLLSDQQLAERLAAADKEHGEVEQELARLTRRRGELADLRAMLSGEQERRMHGSGDGDSASRPSGVWDEDDEEGSGTDDEDGSVCWSEPGDDDGATGGSAPQIAPPPEATTWQHPPEEYPPWPQPAMTPGDEGFNDWARAHIQTVGTAAEGVRCMCESGGDQSGFAMQPYQRTVAYLLHPRSPVSRLLVYHQIGAGKTLEMIQIVQNFFHDPRPKLVIFPTQEIVRMFYTELLKWPSLYRDYVCLRVEQRGREIAMRVDQRAAFAEFRWRDRRSERWPQPERAGLTFQHVRDALFMPHMFHCGRARPRFQQEFRDQCSDPGDKRCLPAAPLRVYRYTVCYNAGRVPARGGRPRDPLFSIGMPHRRSGDTSPESYFSHKVVLMDELHNLVQRSKWAQQLTALKHELRIAANSCVAGFTGSPVMRRVEDTRRLLDVIKGRHHASGTDEGFVSCFTSRPRAVFAAVTPEGALADSGSTFALPPVCMAHAALKGPALRKYCEKLSEGKDLDAMRCYSNIAINYAQSERIMQHLYGEQCESYAPKLHAAAEMVVDDPRKTLVLVHRTTGLRAFAKLLERRLAAKGQRKPTILWTHSEEGRISDREVRRRNAEIIRAFNAPDNRLGQGSGGRVCVADTAIAGEGLSFFHVRLVVLLDVPSSWAALQQSLGRALRMCGHHGLPTEEQSLEVRLFAAAVPPGLTRFGAWLASRQTGQWADWSKSLSRAVGDVLGEGKLGDGDTTLHERDALEALRRAGCLRGADSGGEEEESASQPEAAAATPSPATPAGYVPPTAEELAAQPLTAVVQAWPAVRQVLDSLDPPVRMDLQEMWGMSVAGDAENRRELVKHCQSMLDRGVCSAPPANRKRTRRDPRQAAAAAAQKERDRKTARELQLAQKLVTEARRFTALGLKDEPLTSGDELLLERMREEGQLLQPALEELRGAAIDRGLYDGQPCAPRAPSEPSA